MDILIKNCNNIDSGAISITKNKLNIKYGLNGTGKSTIARALKYKIKSPEKLKELIPFKLLDVETDLTPEVDLSEEINSIMIFDEEYVDQIVYQQDELILNSFEILIKTPQYIESMEKIELSLDTIKKVFSENDQLSKIIDDFRSLSKSFRSTTTGLSKSSDVYKALKNGNIVEHIPENLRDYTSFIKSENCTDWLAWHSKGANFIDIDSNCPYCILPIGERKEIIKSVSTIYDKNIVKNFALIIEAISNLGGYFSPETKDKLTEILNKPTGLDDLEENYFFEIRNQIDNILSKLVELKSISPENFSGNSNVEEKIRNLKIKIELLGHLNSEETKTIVDSLNRSLDEILEKIGIFQGEINSQNLKTIKIIEKHKININEFLVKAGYQYFVDIKGENYDYKLTLQHLDYKESIEGGKQHLSFGEKNAFALVLFMHQALSEDPELIILDDPISSFDSSKKYAILDMLFRQDSKKSLKSKTVLMLTHDIEPIIDTIKVLSRLFSNTINAKFINIVDGILNEIDILKGDILSFSQICNNIIDSEVDGVIKVIYLRKYYESIDNKGNEYQVLSNLIHGCIITDLTDTRIVEEGLLSEDDFNNGSENIKKKFETFDYGTLLERINNIDEIIEIYNDTEDFFVKVVLFRIFNEHIDDRGNVDEVFMKYINESYHIENDFIFQLDPSKFNLIPQYIIKKCDSIINNA